MPNLNSRICALLVMGLSLVSVPRLEAQDEPPAPVLRGDVDGDGRVTVDDAAAVRAWLVRGTLPGGRAILPAGDANGDGRVTAADAAVIARYAAGVDVSRFAVGRPVEEGARTGAFATVEYECVVDLEAGATNCAPSVSAGTVPASAGVPDGPRLDVLSGTGPLTFVSSWVHSRGSTADEDTSMNTLRFVNNMGQPIGTTDGTSAASPGSRVFFTTVPYVVSVYSGTVAAASIQLVTPDGTATFSNPENTVTFADRPYYEYEGLVEAGDTTAPREIRYIYSAAVKSFGYKYRVSAPVQYEYGWITVSPATVPDLYFRSTTTLTGAVYDAFGVSQADGITWSSSNTSVATVNASTGQVTAVAVGTATITATSTINAQRTGSRSITVTSVNTWEGDVSSNWSTAGNWSAGVVPDSATEAVIPAAGSIPNMPVLTANASVLDLSLGAGSTLGLGGFTLRAYDDVAATGTISNGTLWLSGSAAGVQGNVGGAVLVSGSAALQASARTTGAVSVTGSLTVSSGALTISIP